MTYYIIDAFADALFRGNPAGVVLADSPLDAGLMQSIAAENNLSETAFPVKKDGYYDLRWFTPACEVDLCGHATLASSYVIFNHVEPEAGKLFFETRSGRLTVTRGNGLYVLDFPSAAIHKTELTPLMEQAAKAPVVEAYTTGSGSDLILLLENEGDVISARPDFELIKQLAPHAVTITAPGTKTDFTSRFFGPNVGVPEDPVTGSVHTKLTPFWAKRLGKNKLTAFQASKRGGLLHCEDCGDRILIGGNAAEYLRGEIAVK